MNTNSPKTFFAWSERIIALSMMGAVFLFAEGCAKKAEAPAPETAKEAAPRVSRGTNGEIFVMVTPESQALAGIRVEALAETEQKPTVKAFGRVLDPSTLGPLVADAAAASATAEASAAESKRLETLAGQSNASARAVEAGKAAAARDKALLEAARLKLVSAWGTAIATNTDLASLVNALAAQKALLIQLNLELGAQPSNDIQSARVTSVVAGTNQMEARVLGPAPNVDAQTQGRGLLLLSEKNALHLSPGAAVLGLLEQRGESRKGVVIPAAAIVHHNGALWAYLQVAADKFERRRLPDEGLGAGIHFVAEQFHRGEKIVTAGAQALLSEELKSTESIAE
jgi:multidrug efflux system membrane fusion protein